MSHEQITYWACDGSDCKNNITQKLHKERPVGWFRIARDFSNETLTKHACSKKCCLNVLDDAIWEKHSHGNDLKVIRISVVS